MAGADHGKEGPGLGVLLRYPHDIVHAGNGVYYVSDSVDGRIKKIGPDFRVTNVAGTGVCCSSGDGGPALQARLESPSALAYDPSRNRLYFVEESQGRIRAVDLNNGTVFAVAGTGGLKYTAANEGQLATRATIAPEWIASDSAGNLFVSDERNQRVYRIDAATRVLRTVAGVGIAPPLDDAETDGKQATAVPIWPVQIAVSGNNLVFVDRLNLLGVDLTTGVLHTVLRTRVRKDGVEQSSTFGFGKPVFSGAILAPVVLFRKIYNFDFGGTIDIADFFRNLQWQKATTPLYDASQSTFRDYIRGFAQGPSVLTVGMGQQVARLAGEQMTPVVGVGLLRVREPAAESYLQYPMGIAFHANGELAIAELDNAKIRILDATGQTIRIPAAIPPEEYYGMASGYGTRYNAVAVTTTVGGETLFTAGHGGLSLPKGEEDIDVLAGYERFSPAYTGFSGDGGAPERAMLNSPTGIAILPDGSILIADRGNSRIRRISADRTKITTVAGDGTRVFRPGAGPLATGMDPYDVAVGPDGMAYIADVTNSRVYRFDLARQTIESIAGTGVGGYSGDGGLAQSAQLNRPTGVAVSRKGEIYIADYLNFRIRRITKGGGIQTIAGNGKEGVTGDGGTALAAAMVPFRVAVAPDDSIYFSDNDQHRIRKLVQTGPADAMTILHGNRQTGPVNIPLPQTLRVVLRTGDGKPIAGKPIQFAIASGKALILGADTRSSEAGIAEALVMITEAGSASIRVTSPLVDEVTFVVTGTAAEGPVPLVNAQSVYGAGLTVTTLAPLGLGAVFGAEFGPEGLYRESVAVEGQLPLVSEGICVEIQGTRVPLVAVSSTRIDFQVPGTAATGSALFQVSRDCGGATETRSVPLMVEIRRVSPELQTWTSGSGPQAVRAVDTATGNWIGPVALGTEFRPALAGQAVTVFGTGLGAVEAGDAAKVVLPVSVRFREKLFPATARLAANEVGVYAVSFVLPAEVAAGEYRIELFVGGVDSPRGTMLAVGAPE